MEKENNELSGLLVAIISIASVISVFRVFMYSLTMQIHLGNIFISWFPFVGTVLNVFFLIYFVLNKKNILGVWLFYVMCGLTFIISATVDGFNPNATLMQVLIKAATLSLLLFLKNKGKSAWKFLLENSNNGNVLDTDESELN